MIYGFLAVPDAKNIKEARCYSVVMVAISTHYRITDSGAVVTAAERLADLSDWLKSIVYFCFC